MRVENLAPDILATSAAHVDSLVDEIDYTVHCSRQRWVVKTVNSAAFVQHAQAGQCL
jgi:hypothetical protein